MTRLGLRYVSGLFVEPLLRAMMDIRTTPRRAGEASGQAGTLRHDDSDCGVIQLAAAGCATRDRPNVVWQVVERSTSIIINAILWLTWNR
jgi:hypothetical protein